MKETLNFIKQEKDYYGKIYTDIAFAISEISQFLSEDKLKERKYYIKAETLKKYISYLESAETEEKKRSVISSLFNNNNSSIELLKDYKNKNKEGFEKLEKCAKCKCLNCVFDCRFKGCRNCRTDAYISSCDKEKINVRKFDNFTLDLTNNDTGETCRYKALSILENCQQDKEYIILENLTCDDDKLVLYYYPDTRGASYGEITDSDEFDMVVEAFQES